MIKLKTIIKIANYEKEVAKEILKAVDKAVQKSAIVADRNIKDETPVREGHLRRSIHHQKTGVGEAEVLTRAVQDGNIINYAVYVEYGTIFMSPRAMFRKGMAKSEPKIQSIFEEELGKLKDKTDWKNLLK